MDTSYIQHNAAELQRLRKLIGQLSDQDLARPVGDGWTVSAILAHCAFWDRVARLRWENWQQEGIQWVPLELDVLNNAQLPQWLALPPREAAHQALIAAEQVDHKIETLPPQLAEEYRTSGRNQWMLETWEHRREHINEIEQAI